MDKMKAVVARKNGLFVDEIKAVPSLELTTDLLVEVKAVSINPVDIKQQDVLKQGEEKILGWDASGIVKKVGKDCRLFKVGDEVFYAGSVIRSGSNAQFQVVDEQLVGKKPDSLTFDEAAAVPLTALTAWESLVERLKIDKEKDNGQAILIINGAGGVGSMAIQLSKKIGLQVITTASRTESLEWVQALGADLVLNHRYPLSEELKKNGFTQVPYILCLHDTDQYWEEMCKIIAPEGKICSIVETKQPVNLGMLKDKSASFHWEFMFTKSKYQTENKISQHYILETIAQMYDEKELKSTQTTHLHPIHAENLKKARAMILTGRTIGKISLSSWES